MLLGVPVWLLGCGALAGLLLVFLRAVRSPDGLTVPAAVLVAVTLSGVSAAYELGPVGLGSIALLVGLIAVAMGWIRGDVRLVRSPVWLATAAFLAASTLTLTQARDVGAGAGLLLEHIRDGVGLVVALLLLVAVPRLRPVVAAAVLLVAGLASLTVVQEYVLGNSSELGGFARVPIAEDVGSATARHAGPLADVNFWGRLLVLAFPLALALGTGPDRRQRPWLAAAALVAAGIYLTGSRGSLIALGVSVGVWLLLTRPRPRTLLPLVAGGAALLAIPGVSSRLATLSAVGESATAVVDPSLRNRAAVQVVGLAMAEDHPILGVGLGNFIRREPEYQRATGEFISEGVIAPHNLYLELLAETGVVGLAALLLLIGSAAFVTARAFLVARLLGSAPEAALTRRLSAAVLAALAGWSVASSVLHLANLSALLVLVALGAALDVRARRCLQVRDAVAAARWQWWPDAMAGHANHAEAQPSGPRTTRLAVLAVAALMSAGAGLALGTATPRWTATAVATVVPVEPGEARQAYAYDVRSREQLLPTYAALARSPGFTLTVGSELDIDQTTLRGMVVSAKARVPSAVVDLTVTSTDQVAARRLAPALITAVGTWIEMTDSLYRLEQNSRAVTVGKDPPPLGGPLPFAGLAGLCVVAAVVELRRGGGRRQPAEA
ncbi:MAG: O-antigen ligase family protein [Actinomycetota bacterium]|nr:O-antigen ligase family protein [Actinomycetota bacterium]